MGAKVNEIVAADPRKQNINSIYISSITQHYKTKMSSKTTPGTLYHLGNASDNNTDKGFI